MTELKPGGQYANADLEDADLGDLDVSDADFTGANLRCAEFYGTNAQRAIFRNANMGEAGFDNGADLRGADLRGANLADCCFMGEQLTGAKYDDTTKFPAGFDPTKRGLVRG